MPSAGNISENEPQISKVFPYPIFRRTLGNGLDVLVVETPEFHNVLSYNTLVMAGSRNEMEKGKTGLAHLFEHIQFRHIYRGQSGGYVEMMKRLGTHNNAWTWFDVTLYHPLTFASNLEGKTLAGERLPGIAELESSRFMALEFDEKIFKIETGAVLGEYRNGATSPTLKMGERLLGLAFPDHPYGHETIGYFEDVLDMPNQYEAARDFYNTYYRPNNCLLVVGGDVQADRVFDIVESHYSAWQAREIPQVPAAAPFAGPQRGHVAWKADVAPRMYVAYRMPRFVTGSTETAVAALLSELLISRSAPLYRRLRFEKQSASELGLAEGPRGFESFDSRILTFDVQLFKDQLASKGDTYFEEVAADIEWGVESLKNFSRQAGSDPLLETLKSKFRYDFLAAMSSPADIAHNLSWYYRFDRDPQVFETLLAAMQRLVPEDIDVFAQTYFRPDQRIMVTLAAEASVAQKSV
jgi:zinc protease